MANKASKLVLISLLVCSVGIVFFLLSFGTGNWLEGGNQGFLSMGLWEACFKNWRYYKDPTQNQYDGCRWMLSSDFDDIREWIWPTWLRGVQGIMCVSLILEISAVIVYVVVMFHMLRQKYFFIILLGTAVANIISAFFCFVSMIVFHIKALNDLRWIENNEKHNQGWSFYILIPAMFCFVISGLTTFMSAWRFRRDANDRPVAIPYRS
ncbi:uncharacterized protein LOC133178576 [Saccostrea echinata]|uniref:uncharacterized protein LOC133178576 n=1 Tax=Saccostrea echinata TaxID=191078 RepID=UPI002A7EF80C|nr:uncharacterized protein LOC133178576 [Saccostrea echinata]